MRIRPKGLLTVLVAAILFACSVVVFAGKTSDLPVTTNISDNAAGVAYSVFSDGAVRIRMA
jgi:hypothetical protein